jgi:hypothetical protein
VKRILLNLLLVLGITFTGSPVAKAQTFQNLAQINGLTQSELIINSTPKAGGSLKLSWKFTDQSRGGIRALEEKNVYDRYSGRNYNLKEIETAWVVRVVNLSCFSSNNSPVGKTLSILRVNFLEPFTPVKNLHISPNWIVNESQTDINFGVNEKCAEIRVNSSIELNLQAIASFNSSELSRLVWLDTQTQANLPLISIKGVPAPIKAPTNTPINTPTKKSNPKAKPSSSSKAPSKKASCYIFQGEKIDATYGMAEPPFGVTTIKFENITDCRLDLSIRGDFIGSESGNQKMLCSVNGSWSLDPYSRVEFAPYTNASGSISFKTVFPQLSKCFRTVNAQRNFIAVITGSNEG